MERFEYEISLHTSDEFRTLAYFCGPTGQCDLHDVPGSQADVLKGILNQRGRDGWELVQAVFGHDGLLAIWKRRLA